MESAFVATKYWGTQSINIYTKHNLHCPFTLFPSFFLGDSLLGASLSGNGGDLCRDTKSNNTAAQQGGRHPAAQSYYVIPGLPLTNWMLQALSINSKKTLKQEGGMWRGELHLIRTYCPGSLGKVVYLLSAKLNTVVIMSRVFLFFFPPKKRWSTLAAVAQISHTQDLPAPYSKRQHNANMLLGLQCNYNERCRGVAPVQAAKSDWRVEAGSRWLQAHSSNIRLLSTNSI